MKKKLIIITIGIVLVLTIFFVISNNKKEVILDNVEIKESINKKITFAMYKETDNNTYEEIEGNIFPTTGYILNIPKSKCIDESGNEISDILTYDIANKKVIVDTNKTSYCYLYFAKEIVEFAYTGSEQEFIVPLTGTYKLETWGAQGGNATDTYTGGYGAFSIGEATLSKNMSIYVNVGSQGESKIIKGNSGSGGFNGGSSVERCMHTYNESTEYCGAGGGATHIALESGFLSTFESKRDKIIIVSSGGGGGNYFYSTYWPGYVYCYGGSGGGILGSIGTCPTYTFNHNAYGNFNSQNLMEFNSPATQNSGGKESNTFNSKEFFGKFGGGNSDYYVGGGAGYYGGVGGEYHISGGGSGYIGNINLTNKHMTCYNCQTSNEEHTKTISNTCVNANPVSDCSKIGNGYAKITFIG